MKTEISAGGIVVRKKAGRWEVLVVSDMNDALTFPKGKVEKGEEPLDGAIREIAEEVGVTKIEMVAKLPVIRYMYQRNGLISKTVHYFLFKSAGTELLKPQKEEGLHDAKYIDLDEAIKTIGYAKTNKPLLLWTLKALRTLKK